MDARLKNKKLFLLDMDGTLYLGDRLFDCTPPFLAKIKAGGGRYLFLTNNASRSPDAYVAKLARLGIATAKEDFLTSADALTAYLRGRYDDALIYAAGTESFRRQLTGAGFRLTAEPEQDVSCFVQAFDTELTFKKLDDACRLLTRGADFVATNPDWVCPTQYGYVPDCGAVCDMLFRATGRRPYVVGKPRPDMALLAMARTGCTPEETLLVGDRLYTDIACGLAAGVDTALVLSGETGLAQAESSDIKPTFVFKDVGEILAS